MSGMIERTDQLTADWNTDNFKKLWSIVDKEGAAGDGAADDATAIQAAITANAGGTIYGRPGATYLIGTALTIPSNTTLRDIKLKLKDSANVHMINLQDGVSNIAIENAELDGNKANQTSAVRGVSSTAGSTVTNIRIVRCHVFDCKGDGIGFAGTLADRILISGNISHGHGSSGIDGGQSGTLSNSVISNNIVYNTGEANITCQAACDNVSIVGNACKDSGTADNITAYGGSHKALAITGNVCHDSGNHGIHIKGNAAIAGNIIDNPTNSGIYITDGDNVAVTGNSIDSAAGAGGINFNACVDVLASGNTVRDGAGHGILLTSVTNGVVSGNTSTGNATDGIRLQDSTGIVHTGNRCSGNTSNGIQLDNCTGCRGGMNDYSGNTSTNYLESGTSSGNIEKAAGVITKTTTGDSSMTTEGLLQINTFDNTAKIYADGGWRTVASGW